MEREAHADKRWSRNLNETLSRENLFQSQSGNSVVSKIHYLKLLAMMCNC